MNANWQTLRWQGDEQGVLTLLDQTQLPRAVQEITCRDVETVWEAIRSLRVRGAPAIGIAAAYGVVLGTQQVAREANGEVEFFATLERVCGYLAESRPTAVNLFWAIDRMRLTAQQRRATCPLPELHRTLWQEACSIHDEDRRMCRSIGDYGAELLSDGMSLLTHCNAGGLATSEYGTALAPIYRAHEQGKRIHVFVDETRPLWQGARLTAWELAQQGVPCTLICDSMAAQVMREGRVQAVITGADRIAANGDTANKIGTYGVAVLAQAHGIPFYVAAPMSTFDSRTPNGDGIVIEQRSAKEIAEPQGIPIAPESVAVYNPAFDVTPARLITAIITDRGVICPISTETLRRMAN